MKKLVVIQNRPTQFDVPLYARLDASEAIDLTVFYTVVHPDEKYAVDTEIGIAPQWDHLSDMRYDARFEKSVISLWRRVLALHPDHVIVCGWYPRSHAMLSLLLRVSGVSIGVRTDNTLEHTRLVGLKGVAKRVFMALWLSLFRSWHPVGSLACQYLENLAWVRRPVHYFPYAVDVEWFARNADKTKQYRDAVRRKFGLTPDDFVVFGLMKWAQREDPLALVEAFLKAARNIPNFKLLLVGDGELKDTVMSRLESAPGRSVTPGYAKYSELPMYYALSDIFVHPAQSEPYGVSIQEAMACGLPVLASSGVGAAKDFIKPGMNGDIFPVGNVECLAGLLSKWAKHSDASRVADLAFENAEQWSYRCSVEEFRACLGITHD